MEDKKKFWLWFAGIVLAAALALVGAFIGKTLVGYLLFGLGIAGAVALLVLAFLKKDFFKEGRVKPLVLGLVIGLLLASSALLLLSSGSAAAGQMPGVSSTGSIPQMPSGSFPQGGNSSTSGSGQFTMPSGSNSSSSGFPSTGTMPSRGNTGSSQAVTIVGWVLLGSGALVLAFALLRFFTKKVDYKNGRWMVLLLGLVLGALLGASTMKLFVVSASATPQGMTGQNFPAMTGQTAATAEVTETPAVTSTPAPTSTPKPTATATTASEIRLTVCLSADYRVGLNIRTSPSEDAKLVGTIPAAGCFIINGRSSANPGWYRLAAGQNNMGGIRIYADDEDTNLWVYSVNIDATADNLNRLLDIEVPSK
jgi:hypothetical protein